MSSLQITKELRHKNIVQLYDHGTGGSGFFFTLEYCAGGSINDLMVERNAIFSLPEALPIILQSLAGLAYAHQHEKIFVHRDLKPQNILLLAKNEGTAKIADFGLAKSFQSVGLSGLTATGDVSETFAFMPREQLTNFKRVKPVSDVWSMAATFYFMLTGDTPYDFSDNKRELDVIMEGKVVPLRHRAPQISNRIAEIIEQALAKEVADRFQNAGEFKAALETAVGGRITYLYDGFRVRLKTQDTVGSLLLFES